MRYSESHSASSPDHRKPARCLQAAGLELMAIVAALMLMPQSLQAQPSGQKTGHLRVMSYNMLFEYNVPEQPERQWVNRLKWCSAGLKKNKPDIIGAQEILTFQLRQLLDEVDNYGWVGVGLIKGDRTMERSENEAILYRKDRLEVLDEGSFWLSTTPEKPGTYAWGMKYPRMCNWGKFRELKSGRIFFLFNSHFYVDKDKEAARIEAARLVVEKMKTIASGYPIICTGDLNGTVDSPSIQLLMNEAELKDAFAIAAKRKGPSDSFHGFKSTPKPNSRIDQLLVSGEITVKCYRIIDDQLKKLHFESDHLPVCADITF